MSRRDRFSSAVEKNKKHAIGFARVALCLDPGELVVLASVRPTDPRPRFRRASYSFTVFSRSALLMTEIEERLIAAAAIIGDRSNPNNG